MYIHAPLINGFYRNACYFQGVARSNFQTISWFTMTNMVTKSDDPDEIPRSAAFNQGQHNLLLSGIRDARYKWVYIMSLARSILELYFP